MATTSTNDNSRPPTIAEAWAGIWDHAQGLPPAARRQQLLVAVELLQVMILAEADAAGD